jgi:hypothetical protein
LLTCKPRLRVNGGRGPFNPRGSARLLPGSPATEAA